MYVCMCGVHVQYHRMVHHTSKYTCMYTHVCTTHVVHVPHMDHVHMCVLHVWCTICMCTCTTCTADNDEEYARISMYNLKMPKLN